MDTITNLKQAKQFEQDHRYIEALEALAFAFYEASEDEAVIIEDRRKEVEKKQRDYASKLDKEIQKALKDGDIPRADELLAQLEAAMPGYPRLEALQKLIAARGKEVRAQQRVKSLEEEVGRLLETVEQINFDLALQKAKQAVEAEPDNPLLQRLLEKTEQRRDERNLEVKRITTAMTKGKFDHLFLAFDEQVSRGSETLPWYEYFENEKGGDLQEKPFPESEKRPTSSEAYDHLVELRANWEDQKGQQKLRDAQVCLNSAPEEANTLVDEVKDYKYLSVKTKNEIDAFLEKDVAKAIEQRRQTRIDLEQAKQQEVRTAWQSIEKIEKRDPHAPEIELARQELRDKLKSNLFEELKKLERHRLNGQFSLAGTEAENIRSLIIEDVPLAKVAEEAAKLIQRCSDDARFDKEFDRQEVDIQSLLEAGQLKGADDVYQLLRKSTKNRLLYATRLQALGISIQSQYGLREVVRTLEEEMLAAEEREVLHQLAERCREQAGKFGEPPELHALLRRINLRQI
ncbi:MAG: hypothetical protein JXA42_03580, partial [Anaerolineales bacterium]|nr:hypothetical protein [Anaerolineales bacterium]